MEDSQLLRGILEGCVLGIVDKGETYGYEILAELERCGFDNIYEGTLYPVLTRLEKKELIVCRKAKSPLGPTRKYYRTTEAGKEYYRSFCSSYFRIAEAADKILRNGTSGDFSNHLET